MMTIDEFKNALREGEVNFVFKKKDGTIREARGTLKPELILKNEVKESDEEKPKKKRIITEDVICYFDLDKSAWRSFRFEQFLEEYK